jgi:hypothetical protein
MMAMGQLNDTFEVSLREEFSLNMCLNYEHGVEVLSRPERENPPPR